MTHAILSGTGFRARLAALCLTLAAAVSVAAPAASASNIDFTALNTNLARNHILPRYEFFAGASEQLRTEMKSFCSTPSKGSLHLAQRAFNDAMDTFSEISHIRFGHIEDQNRYQRLYYWPDMDNRIDQALDEALKQMDGGSELDIARSPAEIQGFPALGRLIFGAGAEKILAGDKEAGDRCRLAVAIATNIATLSGQINAEWREGPSAYVKLLETAGSPGNGTFPTASSATKAFLDSMTDTLKLITDVKLPLILKAASEPGDVKTAECWCSGRSLRNIRINLQALRELYKGVNGAGFDDALLRTNVGWLYNDIEAAFNDAITLVNQIDESPKALLTDARVRGQLKSLIPMVTRLKGLVEKLHQLLDRDLRVIVE